MQRVEDLFEEMDEDNSGTISREEFNAYIMADAEVMRDGTFKDKLIERNLVNE